MLGRAGRRQQLSFRRRRHRHAPPRRLLALGVIGIGLLVAGLLADGAVDPSGSSVDRSAGPPRLILVVAGRQLATVPVTQYLRSAHVDSSALRRSLAASLPRRASARRRGATISYRYDVDATAARAARLGPAGGTVEAVRRPTAATITAPIVRQSRRNTCESAALEILLATIGSRVSQERIQQRFPRSGPVDPIQTSAGRVWGDPDRGFVGRPDGGGIAGGFGVYPGPVQRVARQLGESLHDLTGRPAAAVYDRLRRGRAVMAWIGLSAGPYGKWRSPSGRPIKVNFGEHTVVLHGLRSDGTLLVVNPLRGTREQWTKQRFESAWALLGRRALSA